MRRIALEEHFIINEPEHVERWLSTASMIPKPVIEKILPVLADTGDRRIEAMSKAGVDLAVLSNAGSVQGVLDAAPALRLAKQANDYLAGAVQKHPDRFAGFATVPVQGAKAGADELERAMRELGMKGAMLFGQTNGIYLDDDRYQPFWERAEALDAPIYLHASDPMVVPRTYMGCAELQGPVWSWTAETSAHVLRMIFNGVFKRYPKLTLILGHMGETLPYMLWRLDRRAEAFATGGDPVKPAETLRSNVVVTSAGVFSDEPLLCAMKALGDDRVMFSVDYPFESMDGASEWLDGAEVSHQAREAISHGTAERVLRL